ncbi:sulfurtransferase TusA family protein (plasmid) [Nocardiopsis flavescens]|nr:sulfurtransferase TusA family protein [Nocardiopsis flavescens]
MDDAEEEPAVVVDGGDRSCVRLLLELRTRVQELPPGTVVHLLASDPAAPLDLPAWCHLTGHAYLGPAQGYGRPAYGLRVARAPRTTRPDAPWHPAS